VDKKFKFRTNIGENIFYNKYAISQSDTWEERCRSIVDDVCGTMSGRRRRTLSKEECDYLTKIMIEMKFIPGGRYIYYACRRAHYFNNCFLLKAEHDTREEWASLCQRSTSCLMVGGGIGIDYSIIRPKGRMIHKTGGISSGPISLMNMINEIGRNVMQGGSRRSAIYASLNWKHKDINEFLYVKDWNKYKLEGTEYTYSDLKHFDFNYPAPLDMTNISINYDDLLLKEYEKTRNIPKIFIDNVKMALMNGEPGFSFNFGDKQNDTLRNACGEITSEDDSDVCNLGAINLSQIENIDELKDIVRIASKFLVCGTLRADLPYQKVYDIREKNRRLGLGLMGVHEWLLKRQYSYKMNDELRKWLTIYKEESEKSADEHCDRLYLNKPKGYRAIAPTGTIGILAGTTTGIEPLYAVAYKRRYLVNGTTWKYEYVIDSTADNLIKMYDIDPNSIETAVDLSKDPERRIEFQADIQEYVDHAISSTINLPKFGSEYNNEDKINTFAELLITYAPKLRGFTCYPDGSRGGQPLTTVPYKEAKNKLGTVFTEHDVCNITGKGGTCGE